MTREQKIARARELREQGVTYPAVATELGVARGTVMRWLNAGKAERDRETARAWKSRNREVLHAYDARYSREHRDICEECGRPTGFRTVGKSSRCAGCVARESDAKAQRVVALWAEGKTFPEIQAAMGWSKTMLSCMMVRYRDLGYDLPYRYTTGKRAGRKFPDQVAA